MASSLIISQALTLGPGILAVMWPWDQVCACRSQGGQKNLSPCWCKQVIPKHIVAFNSFEPYETCLWACTSGQWAAANTPRASENMPHDAAIITYALRCKHMQTRSFPSAIKFGTSGWKWDWASLWPAELLLSSAFTKLLLNHRDFTGTYSRTSELLQVFAAGQALETFNHCLGCASRGNSALMPSPNPVTASAGLLDTQCKQP